jgi:hypothetical protein
MRESDLKALALLLLGVAILLILGRAVIRVLVIFIEVFGVLLGLILVVAGLLFLARRFYR